MNQPSETTRGPCEEADRTATPDEQSLARGIVYRFLATAFRYPESEAFDEAGNLYFSSGDDDPVFQALAALADCSSRRLLEHYAKMQDAVGRSSPAVLEREYVSLFGHSVRGKCPLYEAEYGESDERLQQPHELSDLAAFYRAFALKLGDGVGERVDFVAVECEFMAFLCVKQGYTEEHGDAELARVTSDAQRKFFRDHLGRWLPACARKIIDPAGDSFYGWLARFALAYVADECRRLEVAPGNEHLKLRLPLKEADACQSCPTAHGKPGSACPEHAAEKV